MIGGDRRLDAPPGGSSNFIRFLKKWLEEVSKKVDAINAMFGRLDGLPIQDLLTRVDAVESRVVKSGSGYL